MGTLIPALGEVGLMNVLKDVCGKDMDHDPRRWGRGSYLSFSFLTSFFARSSRELTLQIGFQSTGGAAFFLVPPGPGMEVSFAPFCQGNFSLAMLRSNIQIGWSSWRPIKSEFCWDKRFIPGGLQSLCHCPKCTELCHERGTCSDLLPEPCLVDGVLKFKN